jgi:hypothetical protein
VMPLIGVGGKERGVCGNRDCGDGGAWVRFGLYTACGTSIVVAWRLAINLRLHTIHFNLGYITFF